jgi:hypothetical protein
MIIEINPATAHTYGQRVDGRFRLLVTEEVTTWEDRLGNDEEKFPGEGCVFFSEDGGTSWSEFYLLGFIGDRCDRFWAYVLNTAHGIPRIISGVGGEVKFAGRTYELITDEKTSVANVRRLDAKDRLMVGDSVVYERLRRTEG